MAGEIEIAVYPIAGRQWFFHIPEAFCVECEMTVHVVRKVIAEMGNPPDISLRIRPWLQYVPLSLLRGGWHPPVVTVNGKRFSQGAVPDGASLKAVLERYMKKESQA
ncbi:MAG: hypothetical protein HY681_13940 [Chloroflexi bacterium]|nr:hypothetical protein [Chloroflexota bacterium]